MKRASPIDSSDADSDYENISKEDAEAKRLFDEAIEQDKKGLVSDPHTLFDFWPHRQILTAPAKYLQGLARGIIKDYGLGVVKRGGTRGPARLPPKGTPERAKIEAARNRGSKAKKREERENIKAGGRGSGVWTDEELEDIRRGGDFPDDVRWHHDPTVANRPDLADDPRAVRPVRGGTQGHLREHNWDWRN